MNDQLIVELLSELTKQLDGCFSEQKQQLKLTSVAFNELKEFTKRLDAKIRTQSPRNPMYPDLCKDTPTLSWNFYTFNIIFY